MYRPSGPYDLSRECSCIIDSSHSDSMSLIPEPSLSYRPTQSSSFSTSAPIAMKRKMQPVLYHPSDQIKTYNLSPTRSPPSILSNHDMQVIHIHQIQLHPFHTYIYIKPAARELIPERPSHADPHYLKPCERRTIGCWMLAQANPSPILGRQQRTERIRPFDPPSRPRTSTTARVRNSKDLCHLL